MAKSDVQLLGLWASPYTNRVQMALKLKSIEHEFIEEQFYIKKSERLLQANPVYQKIPVLIHDHKPICESLLIIQYIDENWSSSSTDHGPNILPSDPYDRATSRFWAEYIDQTWFPQLKELEKASGDEARAACVGKILEGLALLENAFVQCSKGGAFFGGDNVGYIDIVLGSNLGWIQVLDVMTGLNLLDETKAPGLAGWAKRFLSHNAAKDIVPEPQKLVQLFMMMKAAKASSG